MSEMPAGESGGDGFGPSASRTPREKLGYILSLPERTVRSGTGLLGGVLRESASLLVPLTSIVSASTGGWHTIFVTAGVMNFVAAFAALLLLKPLRAGMRRS